MLLAALVLSARCNDDARVRMIVEVAHLTFSLELAFMEPLGGIIARLISNNVPAIQRLLTNQCIHVHFL